MRSLVRAHCGRDDISDDHVNSVKRDSELFRVSKNCRDHKEQTQVFHTTYASYASHASHATKGQAGFESIMVLAVILLLFISVIYFSQGILASLRQNNRVLTASEVCEHLAWSINEAFIAGDGTVISLYLPERLAENATYNITLLSEHRLADIRWQERHYTVPLMTNLIAGQLELFSGEVNISNTGGEILLEQ